MLYLLPNVHVIVDLHHEELAVILSWNHSTGYGEEEKPECEKELGLFVSFFYMLAFS